MPLRALLPWRRMAWLTSVADDATDDSFDDDESTWSDDFDEKNPPLPVRALSPAGSESDLTHPCPLRDIFGLLGEYEQYRRAVYDALVDADARGRFRYDESHFLRGVDGKLGEAIDQFGLKLLDKFTS